MNSESLKNISKELLKLQMKELRKFFDNMLNLNSDLETYVETFDQLLLKQRNDLRAFIVESGEVYDVPHKDIDQFIDMTIRTRKEDYDVGARYEQILQQEQ